MIDYLSLKLGWTTDQILDNAHFDNQRKVALYEALDEYERTRIVPAVAVGFDKKATKEIMNRHRRGLHKLNQILRGDYLEKDEESEIFQMFGSKENIERFLRDLRDNKVKGRQILRG